MTNDPDRTLVLLGAGASKEAGLPLTNEMTNLIVERINRDTVLIHRGGATVLNFVCASLMQYDAGRGSNPFEGIDVERVFTAVQMLRDREDLEIAPFVQSWHPAVERRHSPSLPGAFGRRLKEAIFNTRDGSGWELERQLKQAFDSLASSPDNSVYEGLMGAMTRHLRQQLQIDDSKSVAYLEPLVSWIAAAKSPCLVTLNYDRSVEMAADNLGLRVDTGVAGLISGEGWVVDGDGVGLLKAHGSIDWELVEERNRGTLRGHLLKSRSDWQTADFEPAIIFGRRGKLRARGPYLELLRAFDERLQRTDHLVTIGYSFGDDHINEYVRRWFNHDPLRVLTIVDPGFPANPAYDTFRGEIYYNVAAVTATQHRVRIERVTASSAIMTIF